MLNRRRSVLWGLVVAATATGVVLLAGGDPPASAPAPVASRAAVVTPTATATPTVAPPVTEEPGKPGVDLVATAQTVVTAWQLQDPTARRAALAPWVTPDYLAVIDEADPATIPTAAPAAAAVIVDADGDAAVQVDLTDDTSLTVTLTRNPANSTWQATNIALARPTQ